ncbi:hypothetical protein PIB30_004718 [Stylosanthes scabra]|uniref:Uncharacterized protein n=1 Tax=Stylosanthes scabra TaxID=79078 RepID=A0ABU6S4V6_9FABA|nr:hypothetical protein [Stylosanthes scabra]
MASECLAGTFPTGSEAGDRSSLSQPPKELDFKVHVGTASKILKIENNGTFNT